MPPVPPARRCDREILNELPNEVGLVLWLELRHVRDWAESDAAVRMQLFPAPSAAAVRRRDEARAAAPEIRAAFDAFRDLLVRPVGADGVRLGTACEMVAEWASAQDLRQTEIEWAELAANVDQANPKLANIAGRATRNVNEYGRSEIWFRRGLRLAEEQDVDVERFWGHVGFGKLCKELGRVKEARRHLNMAAKIARQGGPRSLAASAQHDICALLMVRGQLPEAAKRAQRALFLYPKSDPRLPFFGADAALMMVLTRRYIAAAKLARAVLRVLDQPSAKPAILALASRAFAGAGEVEEAAVYRRRALKALSVHPQYEAVARWHLADALRLSGRWEAAQGEAETALKLAETQNDHETARMIRILLDLIASRESAPPRGINDPLREFVRELQEKLARWTPRRARGPGPWGMGRAA